MIQYQNTQESNKDKTPVNILQVIVLIKLKKICRQLGSGKLIPFNGGLMQDFKI